jgi:hypothetical protein
LVGRTTTTLQRHLAELHLNRIQLCCCAGGEAVSEIWIPGAKRRVRAGGRCGAAEGEERRRVRTGGRCGAAEDEDGGGGCGPAEDAVRRKVRSGGGCGPEEGEERRWMRSCGGCGTADVRSGAGCGTVEEEEGTCAPLGFPSCCLPRNASAARLDGARRRADGECEAGQHRSG